MAWLATLSSLLFWKAAESSEDQNLCFALLAKMCLPLVGGDVSYLLEAF